MNEIDTWASPITSVSRTPPKQRVEVPHSSLDCGKTAAAPQFIIQWLQQPVVVEGEDDGIQHRGLVELQRLEHRRVTLETQRQSRNSNRKRLANVPSTIPNGANRVS